MKGRKRCMKQVKNTHETVQEVDERVRIGVAKPLRSHLHRPAFDAHGGLADGF